MLKRFKCHLIRLRSARSACCADQHCKCKSKGTWANNERNIHRVTEMQVFFDAGWRPTTQVVVAVLAHGGQHGKLLLQCWHTAANNASCCGSVGTWRPTWQVVVAVLAHHTRQKKLAPTGSAYTSQHRVGATTVLINDAVNAP